MGEGEKIEVPPWTLASVRSGSIRFAAAWNLERDFGGFTPSRATRHRCITYAVFDDGFISARRLRILQTTSLVCAFLTRSSLSVTIVQHSTPLSD